MSSPWGPPRATRFVRWRRLATVRTSCSRDRNGATKDDRGRAESKPRSGAGPAGPDANGTSDWEKGPCTALDRAGEPTARFPLARGATRGEWLRDRVEGRATSAARSGDRHPHVSPRRPPAQARRRARQSATVASSTAMTTIPVRETAGISTMLGPTPRGAAAIAWTQSSAADAPRSWGHAEARRPRRDHPPGPAGLERVPGVPSS